MYQTVRTLVEMTPQGADFVLASDAPHGETQVLVLHGLHAGTARSESRDHFPKFQLTEDRGSSPIMKLLTLFFPVSSPAHSNNMTWPVKFTLARGHIACSVQALLVDAHQITEVAPVTQALGQLGIPQHWVANCPQQELM